MKIKNARNVLKTSDINPQTFGNLIQYVSETNSTNFFPSKKNNNKKNFKKIINQVD